MYFNVNFVIGIDVGKKNKANTGTGTPDGDNPHDLPISDGNNLWWDVELPVVANTLIHLRYVGLPEI